ncbi:hypothetical protein GCM10022261_00270 [Brevibacterium daeguense]|uniref:Uncharacterized protein n=1 Tax=Brevibacterium daeguense TaxID=909936 RepID=A0ABP8EF47_9MICO
MRHDSTFTTRGVESVDVDWAGIARAARELGGEGSNVLLLKLRSDVDVAVLDDAIPDLLEGPENGGWTQTPRQDPLRGRLRRRQPDPGILG